MYVIDDHFKISYTVYKMKNRIFIDLLKFISYSILQSNIIEIEVSYVHT